MKNIVDSCGWMEYFADGRNADFFASAIEDTKNLLVPAICIYEVFKRMHQQRGETDALRAVSVMSNGKVMDFNSDCAIAAAKVSLDHSMPMADSIILAMGRLNNAVVWTQDADFKGIAGVQYHEKR
jgi:predicted nucleic acid-binding protein